MDDPLPGAPPFEPASGDRLDSWKEIAAYLKRDVTTVQRWEKREGMPVRRHLHDKQGSVYAFRSELDTWAHGRNRFPPEGAEAETAFDPGGPPVSVAPVVPEAALPARPPEASRRNVLGIAGAGAAAGILLVAAIAWLPRGDPDIPNPIADARFQPLTDFDGSEDAAAVSRDGNFVAFLSDRDGHEDVWVTQVGTGQFYNLTRGRVEGLANPAVRTVGFSPDGALVTFWMRRPGGSGASATDTWAVPTLGGQPRPYLEEVAEFDWSPDGSRLVYHTSGPGDPTFVKEAGEGAGRQIFTAAPGLHAHFPRWSPDGAFIYFVQGMVTDAMDIWRIPAGGGAPERITHHNSRVSHPVMPDRRTLMYLASEPDGSGPWLFSVDVETRKPRRVSSGLDRYTSLSASADGRRLAVTVANPKRTLWRMRLDGTDAPPPSPAPMSLTTGSGFSPRLGPGYVLYVSSRGTSDSIWTVADGRTTQLWTAPEARIVGRPEIDLEGRRIAFSVEQQGRTVLYVMNSDGTEARAVTSSLALRGAPAWAPGGSSITTSADVAGTPQLFNISLDGTAAPFVREYAIDPAWSPDGSFVVFSGQHIGTTFPVKAITATGAPRRLPSLVLTRGARRLRFFEGRPALVMMRGDIQHKDLWTVDVESGVERRLTRLPDDFDVRDFDISPDGREIVLERVQEHSDVVLLETRGR